MEKIDLNKTVLLQRVFVFFFFSKIINNSWWRSRVVTRRDVPCIATIISKQLVLYIFQPYVKGTRSSRTNSDGRLARNEFVISHRRKWQTWVPIRIERCVPLRPKRQFNRFVVRLQSRSILNSVRQAKTNIICIWIFQFLMAKWGSSARSPRVCTLCTCVRARVSPTPSLT